MKIDLREIKTFYINLDKDKDKNETVKKELEKFGTKDFTRISGANMPKDPRSGCAKSHYNILSSCSAPTLILEDDCVLLKNNPIVTIPDNADALYIGLSRWGFNNNVAKVGNYSYSSCKGYKDIYKINAMLATHAILYLTDSYIDISKKIAEHCANNSIHVDTGFTTVHKFYNIYALGQPIFYQSTNEKSTKIALKSYRR